MNKKLSIILKIVFGTIIVFVEEHIFYVTILSNAMTKRSLIMWLTFIFGSIFISVINIVFVYISTKNVKLKLKNISFLIISSILSSVVILILSLLFDKNFLTVVDYRNEIDYFTILILSILIATWTSISMLLLKILVKNPKI